MRAVSPVLAVLVVLGGTALAACGGKIEEPPDGTTAATPSGTATAIPTGTGTPVPPPPSSPGPVPPPSDEPAPSNKVLGAQAQPGGLDRIVVFAADPIADSCVRVQLVSPGAAGAYPNVTTPKGWAVERITRAPGATGTITFGPSLSFLPCSIEVHVSALFAASPTLERLDGEGIPVAGCQ